MFRQEIAKKILKSYSVIGAGAFLLILFWLRDNSALLSFKILMSAVIMYVGFGILFHRHDKTLTPEVAVEYILLGLLILMIVYSFVI